MSYCDVVNINECLFKVYSRLLLNCYSLLIDHCHLCTLLAFIHDFVFSAKAHGSHGTLNAVGQCSRAAALRCLRFIHQGSQSKAFNGTHPQLYRWNLMKKGVKELFSRNISKSCFYNKQKKHFIFRLLSHNCFSRYLLY